MKNKHLKEKLAETPSKTLLNCPVTEGKRPHNVVSPFPNWEKLYANSKQVIKTEHGIFHFEIYLKGVTTETSFVSLSRIKVCPKSVVDQKGAVFDFFINPIDKIAICKDKNYIKINWKEGYFTNKVLTAKELNPEEQLNKHLVKLEQFIEDEFYPEILTAITEQSEVTNIPTGYLI